MKTMSDQEVWERVEDWVNTHKNSVYGANAKYGWMHGADRDDTCQDLRLYCFRTIRSLEKEAIKAGNAIDWESKETRRLLTNRTIGLYHANAWNSRTIDNLRQSDFYDIEPGSDADCGITSASLDDVEAWGQYAPVAHTSFNDDEPDAADYYESEELTERIVNFLISILPAQKPGLVKETYLGGDDGVLTHKEAAVKVDRTRSAVTKALGFSKKQLAEFCAANGLSLNMPRKELLKRVQELTAYHKASKRGTGKYGQIKFLISDFLDAEISLESNIKPRTKTRVTGKNIEKRSVTKPEHTVTIEDYITLLGVI